MSKKFIVIDSQNRSRFEIIDGDALLEATLDMKARYPAGSKPEYYAALDLAGFETDRHGDRYDIFEGETDLCPPSE